MLASDPIFTLRTPVGTGCGSLFELFAAVRDGSLLDLPTMQAHQRPGVVTGFAIMMAALERYAEEPPANTAHWALEWDKQIGPDSLRVVAPHDEVAFLQPPTPDI